MVSIILVYLESRQPNPPLNMLYIFELRAEVRRSSITTTVRNESQVTPQGRVRTGYLCAALPAKHSNKFVLPGRVADYTKCGSAWTEV